MLVNGVMRAAACCLALAMGMGSAGAQNFDGTGVVKFGVFGQGTWVDVGVTQPFIASASPSGFAGGVSAGYDWVSKGNWLAGIEVDGSFGDARGKAGTLDFGFDYQLNLRGRLGFYPRRDWLLYGTGGVGYLGIEAQNPGVGQKSANTLTGYVVGGGTEVDWNHVILFSEYLYGDFGDRNFNLSNVRFEATGVQTHLFRLGVKFKVGHDYVDDIDPVYRRYERVK